LTAAASRLGAALPVREAPVLLYHRIARTTPAEDPLRLSVPPERFATQMRTLARAGFRVRSLEHLGRWCGGRELFLSFDDGYLDNHTVAFPILQRLGFTATIFVATAHVGGSSRWDAGNAAPLMSWSQVAEMERAGFSFQSHTRTHADLCRCDDATALEELRGSRRDLEDRLGHAVTDVAYPFGSYDERVARLAMEAGYRAGWAGGLADGGPFARERFQVAAPEGLASFGVKVSGYGAWLRRVGHRVLAGLGRGELKGTE
jgi:peptidoglycan/xylan/chitin deacetylase (PgdA/CDA1 family)